MTDVITADSSSRDFRRDRLAALTARAAAPPDATPAAPPTAGSRAAGPTSGALRKVLIGENYDLRSSAMARAVAGSAVLRALLAGPGIGDDGSDSSSLAPSDEEEDEAWCFAEDGATLVADELTAHRFDLTYLGDSSGSRCASDGARERYDRRWRAILAADEHAAAAVEARLAVTVAACDSLAAVTVPIAAAETVPAAAGALPPVVATLAPVPSDTAVAAATAAPAEPTTSEGAPAWSTSSAWRLMWWARD